jgi:hypothetical protein
VIDVRLRILARQDRPNAYLNFSQAAGADLAHAEMLVGMGRIEDAVEYESNTCRTPTQSYRWHRRSENTATRMQPSLSPNAD